MRRLRRRASEFGGREIRSDVVSRVRARGRGERMAAEEELVGDSAAVSEKAAAHFVGQFIRLWLFCFA